MAVSIGSAQIETVFYCYSNGEWRYCTPEETILAEKAGTAGTLRFISDDEIRSLLFSPRLSLNYNCNLATQTEAQIAMPEPTPVVTPVYQKMAYRYSFTWPPVTYPTCPPCPPATPTPPVPDTTRCTNDAQCVPAQCCHPRAASTLSTDPTVRAWHAPLFVQDPSIVVPGTVAVSTGNARLFPARPLRQARTQTPTITGVYISDLNVTAEYVRLTNPGPNFVVLTGWTIADNAGRRVRFVKTTTPSGAMVDSTIQGYSTLTLITGRAGVSTPTVIYYPLEMWNDTGDTAYLYNAGRNAGQHNDQITFFKEKTPNLLIPHLT